MSGAGAAETNRGGALNAANLLTVSRLFLTVPILLLMYAEGAAAAWVALGLFVVAVLTDTLDGYFARRDPNRSTLGNYLDPVADKVLLISVFICLADQGIVAGWMVIVLVCREFVVNGVRSAAATQGALVTANWMGKTKGGLQMAAVLFGLLGSAVAATGRRFDSLGELFHDVTWWITLLVSALAVVFALIFFYWNRALFRGKAAT